MAKIRVFQMHQWNCFTRMTGKSNSYKSICKQVGDVSEILGRFPALTKIRYYLQNYGPYYRHFAPKRGRFRNLRILPKSLRASPQTVINRFASRATFQVVSDDFQYFPKSAIGESTSSPRPSASPTNDPGAGWTIARCDWHNLFSKTLFVIGLFRCVVAATYREIKPARKRNGRHFSLSLISIWSLQSPRSSAKRWDDRGDPCDQRCFHMIARIVRSPESPRSFANVANQLIAGTYGTSDLPMDLPTVLWDRPGRPG